MEFEPRMNTKKEEGTREIYLNREKRERGKSFLSTNDTDGHEWGIWKEEL